MTRSTLPERVAQVYYTYGLFCSSYPVTAISLALSIVLLCCYPLLNVPLPGNIPTVITVPLDVNTKELFFLSECNGNKCQETEPPIQPQLYYNETQKLPHVWAKERPLLYIQQVIMKIGVSPWKDNLKMWDAFRAPLQEVFRLIETIKNHEDPETKSTLLHHCYQVEGIKKQSSKASSERVLPEYGCILLSPANLWQQNLQTFSLDASIITTIYNYQKSKNSIAEMAFGMQLRDTGVKRYPLRTRPRTLQYAVTIFYQRADKRFIQSLTKKLKEMYPLYEDNQKTINEITLIYYPGQFKYGELVHLLITFVGIFLYVYFSVRKIEFIKSKLGLAACAVLTIAGSLSMSMGICFYFGFTLSLQGKEIFPYLVIIVGLENVLVLTKSVTSTDSRLDVKIRLAQGLTKEGWSITKNLLTEITIFTLSFFTFVPFIQEFSIFMIVSLLSDYFMQMVFFATTLGIDVRRMELLQERNNKLHLKDYFNANNALNWRYNRVYNDDASYSPQRMRKSKSHPRLNGMAQSGVEVGGTRGGGGGGGAGGGADQRVPKRIRLVNLWARTRFFQRAFMLWMLVWISMIVYNSGIVEYFITNVDKPDARNVNTKAHDKSGSKSSMYSYYNDKHPLMFPPLIETVESDRIAAEANDTLLLKHSPHSRPWTRLSPYHWSGILSMYNASVGGRYAALLPPVLLSHRVGPERAAALRHPDERDPSPRWQALATALDPIDTAPELEVADSKVQGHQWGQASELPIYPTTPMEVLLLAVLCVISVAVIAYMMAVLYRCVCSRHYAEWRASWSDDDEYRKIIAKQPAIQLVMEAVPLVVAGHAQEVECLVTDGEKVVSSCLQGNVKVWESQNGEIITNIDRSQFFKFQSELSKKGTSNNNTSQNSYEAYLSPELLGSTKECIPIEEQSTKSKLQTPEGDSEESRPASSPLPSFTLVPMYQLRKGLSNHLSGLRFRSSAHVAPPTISTAETTKYVFAKNYRELYCSDQHDDLHSQEATDSQVHCADSSEFSFNNSDNCENRLSDNRLNSIKDTSKLFNGESRNGCDPNRSEIRESPIWCMDFCNDLIMLGCADGRLEFWEASSGKLMCVWWGTAGGVTMVRFVEGGRRAAAAALSGHLTLLRLDAAPPRPRRVPGARHAPTSQLRRTHKRCGSAGSLLGDQSREPSRARLSFSYESELCDGDEVVCSRIAQCRPHQQPITEMHSKGGRIVTGAQDHVLKVFSSSELSVLFTLHGHCGPITSCFIDHDTPTIAGSGSQDGLLCVWDLHTGACLYSTQAHNGAVTSLAYTASYVVSSGSDERLCIWDRFQGHMLNSIHIGLNYMSRMLPLTHTLLVMGDRGGLNVYDLSSGDIIRRVLLGQTDGCIYVRQILPLKDAIVCDYANQLRIVRFPLVSRLCDMKSE